MSDNNPVPMKHGPLAGSLPQGIFAPFTAKQEDSTDRGWCVYDATGMLVARRLTAANALLIADSPTMLTALQGLFTHCAMIHKHWGQGSNQKAATAAIETASSLIAKLSGTAPAAAEAAPAAEPAPSLEHGREPQSPARDAKGNLVPLKLRQMPAILGLPECWEVYVLQAGGREGLDPAMVNHELVCVRDEEDMAFQAADQLCKLGKPAAYGFRPAFRDDSGNGPCIIIGGDAVNGLELYGPFLHTEVATAWAENALRNDTWIVSDLIDPNAEDKPPAEVAPKPDPVRAALTELLDWARENTGPRMVNSPHEILIRCQTALESTES